jgi:hypothetical protein
MPVTTLLTALQAQDDGVFLPEDGGSAIVWIIFIGIVAGLYVIVSRTRRRAEDEFWDRKRAEDSHRELPEPEDPTHLP